MRFTRSLIASAMLLSYLSIGIGAAFADSLLLEGKIEHSDKLDPLDRYQVGTEFDESLLPTNTDCSGNWWRVPDWLAGKWHKKGKLHILEYTDLQRNEPIPSPRTVKVHYPDAEVLGHQTDRNGRVWTFVPLPCVGRTYSGPHMNVNIYHSFDLLEEKQNSMTVRLFLVTLMVSRETNKVVSICQRESLQTWTLVDDHHVSILDSTKFFDKDGVPLATKQLLSYSHRCNSYCPVDFLDKRTHRPVSYPSMTISPSMRSLSYVPLDLRDSFADYLRDHNLTSLIPQ